MARKPTKDDVDIFFDYGIHLPTRTIYMGSEGDEDGDESGVNYLMAERVIKGLHLLEAAAPLGDQPITLILNTPGGYEDHGMAIYDTIKACKNFVTIKVRGNAHSMGSYILQAADERIMSPSSTLMFHMGTSIVPGDHPKIVRKWVEYEKVLCKKLDAILLDRINAKRDQDNKAHMSKSHFEKLNDFDTILSAEQAFAWGLCDKIE